MIIICIPYMLWSLIYDWQSLKDNQSFFNLYKYRIPYINEIITFYYIFFHDIRIFLSQASLLPFPLSLSLYDWGTTQSRADGGPTRSFNASLPHLGSTRDSWSGCVSAHWCLLTTPHAIGVSYSLSTCDFVFPTKVWNWLRPLFLVRFETCVPRWYFRPRLPHKVFFNSKPSLRVPRWCFKPCLPHTAGYPSLLPALQ